MPTGVYERSPEHRAALGASVKRAWDRRGRVTEYHGTANGYVNHGCRCDECRSAWHDYNVASGRQVRCIAAQLARGVRVMNHHNHHRGMAELKAQLGDPRPRGMELSLVNHDSPDAYDGHKHYRLSTNPDDYAWETHAANCARRVYV